MNDNIILCSRFLYLRVAPATRPSGDSYSDSGAGIGIVCSYSVGGNGIALGSISLIPHILYTHHLLNSLFQVTHTTGSLKKNYELRIAKQNSFIVDIISFFR